MVERVTRKLLPSNLTHEYFQPGKQLSRSLKNIAGLNLNPPPNDTRNKSRKTREAPYTYTCLTSFFEFFLIKNENGEYYQ